MCYAIPGKVVALNGRIATVEYFGEQKEAINELERLKIGDYTYAQGGYIIDILSEAEALDILEAWKEVFKELKKTDSVLSRVTKEDQTSNQKLSKILDKVTNEVALHDQELEFLYDLKSSEDLNLLYKTANFLRQKHQQNSCCVHGIIEISNACKQSCGYCGINCHNQVKRYKMSLAEVLEAAKEAIEKHGFKVLVLQSGEGAYTVEELVEIIIEIKKRWACLIFISFGEVGLDGLQKLWDAGARGLLMRFETSNPELYQKIHPGMSLENRLAHLRKAYKLGYLVLTGSLIGLPGQTTTDLIKDIRLAIELNSEMLSFGPFLPSPGTPLSQEKAPKTSLILKTLAIARLLDPKKAKILITTALETLDPFARELGLMSGGNSVMLNITPLKYRELYSIYPKRAHEQETVEEQINTTIDMLKKIGRAPTDLSI